MSLLFDERYRVAAVSLMTKAKKEIFLMGFLFVYPAFGRHRQVTSLYEALFGAIRL